MINYYKKFNQSVAPIKSCDRHKIPQGLYNKVVSEYGGRVSKKILGDELSYVG